MSESGVSYPDLREQLSVAESVKAGGFELARALCAFASSHQESPETQELVLRAREFREQFGPAALVVDGLIRQIGLFPYLTEPEDLSAADQLAYEAHRPENMEENLVFHRPQAEVYRALLGGENVVLAAPASFGKSLITDALVATGRYRDVVMVVPTLALVDETRRRLSRRFGRRFKVITHATQSRSDRNIMVGTQERILSMDVPEHVDLLVVDEFYKLSPGRHDDDERCMLLNEAVYRLLKRAKQFYMLGPNIDRLGRGMQEHLTYRSFMQPSYQTVVSELHEEYRKTDEERLERLVELCRTFNDPTLIFCKSPRRATGVARALLSAGLGESSELCERAADWVAAHYHPEWGFAKALRRGIGVHHGRISRALGQLVVRAFNDEQMKFLVCTSTLIEGVNTTARNMMVLDRQINRRNIDLFTFNNIRGRSGRMFRHFVGHVYVFHPPPQDELPVVDAPALTQSESVPESLLIQIDNEDLSEDARRRVEKLRSQDVLRYETLRENDGVDPFSQLQLAQEIADNVGTVASALHWEGMPRYRQLETACDLMWRHFDGGRKAQGSVVSAKQLAYLVSRLQQRPTTADLIREQRSYATDPDKAVEDTLHFLRTWAGFHFPKLLQTLDRIQRDVLGRLGLPTGNYEAYATRVENFFLPAEIVALDEYGLPVELARKLGSRLESDGDLDATLAKLKRLDPQALRLSWFERELVRHAQDGL